MRVGICSESDYDTIVLSEIIRKLGIQHNPTIPVEFLNPYEVGTTITSKMAAAAAIFFDTKQAADIVIFGVDLDGKRHRRLTVNSFVKRERTRNPDRRVVPLFIEPHLEGLFFAEGGNALKATLLGLSPTDPIPYPDLEPKSRLRRLIKEFGSKDLSVTVKDIYGNLAHMLDLGQLSRNHSDFRRFEHRFVSDFRLP